MQKSVKIAILVLSVGVVAVVAILWANSSNTGSVNNDNSNSTAPTVDPMDSVLSFYDKWLEAEQSTTTDPVQAGLLDHEMLTPEARAALEVALAERTDGSPDPVLCQLTTPNQIGTREVFALDTSAQVRVLARGGEEKSQYQAVVSLVARDGVWRISEIACSRGESGPDREFSFEREGFLLKSVPPTLNSDYWHIVFEENGVLGHTAPLFFSPESMCVSADGVEAVCNEAEFVDAAPARVQGEMTESGVDVKRIELQ